MKIRFPDDFLALALGAGTRVRRGRAGEDAISIGLAASRVSKRSDSISVALSATGEGDRFGSDFGRCTPCCFAI